MLLLPALLLAAAVDTTTYVVDNHGRKAGEMTVATRNDSLIVRWVYTDRNRGGRLETRYRLGSGGATIAGEQRAVLLDGSVGD